MRHKRNARVSAALTHFRKLPLASFPTYIEVYNPDPRDPTKITNPDKYAALVFLRHVSMTPHHTLACLKSLRRDADTLARWVREYQAFLRAWPHACTTCGASGLLHDAGDFYQPPSDDACDACVGQGKCPRCGEVVFGEDDEGNYCPLCGWVQWTPAWSLSASATLPLESGAEFYCDCPVAWE